MKQRLQLVVLLVVLTMSGWGAAPSQAHSNDVPSIANLDVSNFAQCHAEHCTGTVPGYQSHLQEVANARQHTRGSNSQIILPRNLLFADIDADGASDFVQYGSNKLFVSKTDFEKTGILHLYMNRTIKRVLTGDFYSLGYDQVCILTDDNSLACFGTSPDRHELWWAFTQSAFFANNEDTIVGDFDGNGRDDILVYPRDGGAFRMYTIIGEFFFEPQPAFNQGNLAGIDRRNQQIRAGDFNADGRADLMLVNSQGQVLFYGSVFDGANNTFWWGFTTNSGFVQHDDQVSVARIDDNMTDDMVTRNRVTGATRIFRMEWTDGVLSPITNVALGQLNVTGNSLLFWGFMHPAWPEPGAQNRDDAMVYDLTTNQFVRTDARWDGSNLTYWWAYTQDAPNNYAGWLAPEAKPWLLLKCKYKGVANEPYDNAFYRKLMLDGIGLAGYWQEVSYGTWDLSGSTVVDAWQTMAVTQAEYAALPSRWARAGACIDAYHGRKDGYINVISLINGDSDGGNDGGRVLSGIGGENITFLAHEMGHTFGWEHSFDDSPRIKEPAWPSKPGEYYDFWDIMSAQNVHTFMRPPFGSAGPEMNGPYRLQQWFIPPHRILYLSYDEIQRGVQMNVAALNRPEANGPLLVRIGDDDQNYYTIEYRMKLGWDQGIPQATILVHQVVNGRSYLKTNGSADYQAERLVGSASTFWLGRQSFTIRVHDFAAEGYTAAISVDATQNVAPKTASVFLPLVRK